MAFPAHQSIRHPSSRRPMRPHRPMCSTNGCATFLVSDSTGLVCPICRYRPSRNWRSAPTNRKNR